MAQPCLSVIVPTLDAAATLPATLASLDAARAEGVLREVLVVDGGSDDGSLEIAATWGTRVLQAPRGRGAQLAAGGAAAQGDWLLFLHADTRLGPGWVAAARAFMAQPRSEAPNSEGTSSEAPNSEARAAAFRLVLDDADLRARLVERLANWRARTFGLPYGDQGLLITRDFYQELGGYRPLPLMEDVELVRRIGRRRIAILDAEAVTSAARYRRGGWWLRPLRNLALLGLYFLGVPPRLLARLYG